MFYSGKFVHTHVIPGSLSLSITSFPHSPQKCHSFSRHCVKCILLISTPCIIHLCLSYFSLFFLSSRLIKEEHSISFWVWLISLNTLVSRFIHIPAKNSFVFPYGQITFHCVCVLYEYIYNFLFYPCVSWLFIWSGCAVSCAAISRGM